MRAVYVTRFGGPEVLQVREARDPVPGPGEVRIRTHAAGLNFAELMGRLGFNPDAPKPPCILGYEVAGVVDATGAAVTHVAPGDRVFALARFGGHAELVWAVIASMYIGNIMLLVLNLPLVGMWARIVVIPFYILGPIIVFCSVVGTYSIRYQTFDVWVMLLFGVIGYFMRKFGWPVAPMVLATVLAQMLETSLGQSLLMSRGSMAIFFTRPVAAVFMILGLLSVGRGF
ncbi:MAG TPA: tripartite tricarboxylate transporter permease, partial [Anaeromyxobacter sp.]|nr:tripartite tricarboxylate transporter permease [Anaeromyxobacter sp.]